MAILNVNPTRAEMRVLIEKRQIAVRGHTLLKEKQDSMVRRFIKMIDETKAFRHKVMAQLDSIFRLYQIASTVTDDTILQKNLHATKTTLDIQVHYFEILGISVPRYEHAVKTENTDVASLFLTPDCWDQIDTLGNTLTADLVRLAEMEKRCYLFGQEIIATRRRVNALEFRTIPDLEETISYIRLKIEDGERNQIAKMLKLK